MVQKKQQGKTSSAAYQFLTLSPHMQVAIRSNSPDMTTVFHAKPYDKYTEINSNRRRKKLYITNQDFNFLRGSFNKRDIKGATTKFKRER